MQPIKPSSDNFIKTKQLIKKLSYTELEQTLIRLIKYFEHDQLSKILLDMIKNNLIVNTEQLLHYLIFICDQYLFLIFICNHSYFVN